MPPCDTIQVAELSTYTVEDMEGRFVQQAIIALGFTGIAEWASGKIVIQGSDQSTILAMIKKKYAELAADGQRGVAADIVRKAATDYGWQIDEKEKWQWEIIKRNPKDVIKVEILADGTIKTETDKVSMPNHSNAEQFLLEIAKQAGGKVERHHKHGKGEHVHKHVHAHGGHSHSH